MTKLTLNTNSPSASRREKLRRDPSCQFVNFSQYSELLISRDVLERDDDGKANLMGLHNRKTGIRFLIELEKIPVIR